MATFVVEWELEGAGWLSAEQLQGIARRCRTVGLEMESRLQWLKSYVTENKFYCVYIATDVAAVQEHARRGEFPVSQISEVIREVDPEFAEL